MTGDTGVARRDRDPPDAGVGAPDRGAAVVDAVLVLIPLTFLVLAILELALVVFVRTTVVDALSEGARVGASADRSPDQGARYARDLIGQSLSPAYARSVSAAPGADGTVVVAADVPLPLFGIATFGLAGMHLHGHAVRELVAP